MAPFNDMWSLTDAKAEMLNALRSLGIQTVIITYNGEGDDGQMEEITVDHAHTAALDVAVAVDLCGDGEPLSRPLRDVLDDFGWQVLDLYHCGFEINDGGHGTITIDVANGKVTLDHNEHVIEYVQSVTEV